MVFSLRGVVRPMAVLMPILALGWMSRDPVASPEVRSRLAERFRFTRTALPEPPGGQYKSVRAVNPTLEKISSWISAVGAAVALGDLDQDGLSNDVCYVDTRTDRVIVTPVPGTPERYKPFMLDPTPLRYDPAAMAPMGSLMGDFNEDGNQDILVYYWGRTPVLFMRQKPGMERAAFTAQELLPSTERWYTNAATQADLDGDGHTDLIIGNYFPDGSRILDAKATNIEAMQKGMSRAYNGGRTRMFLWSGATTGEKPTASFRECEDAMDRETAHGWTLAVGAADLDGDLLPEVYLGHDFGPDRLLHNRSTPGHPKFVRLEGESGFFIPPSKVLGHDSYKGMGVDFGDLNNDGLLDFYVSNITAEYALQESQFVYLSTGKPEQMQKGIAPYREQSESLGMARSGWCWEARLADFDNDGVYEAMQATGFVKGTVNRWPELQELAMGGDELLSNLDSWPHFQPGTDLCGNQHNPFFVRAPSGRYADIAAELGIATTEVSRGIATADVDGDGRLDFAVANQWEPSYFYHNESTKAGTFLHLYVRMLPPTTRDERQIGQMSGLPRPNIASYPAIGATAIVHLPDGGKLTAQVDGGNGHSGKRSPELHFGLGDTPQNQPVTVELSWRGRDGQKEYQTFTLTPGSHTIYLNSNDMQKKEAR